MFTTQLNHAVIAGLVPAIQCGVGPVWITGTSPVMTVVGEMVDEGSSLGGD